MDAPPHQRCSVQVSGGSQPTTCCGWKVAGSPPRHATGPWARVNGKEVDVSTSCPTPTGHGLSMPIPAGPTRPGRSPRQPSKALDAPGSRPPRSHLFLSKTPSDQRPHTVPSPQLLREASPLHSDHLHTQRVLTSARRLDSPACGGRLMLRHPAGDTRYRCNQACFPLHVDAGEPQPRKAMATPPVGAVPSGAAARAWVCLVFTGWCRRS